MKITKEIIQRIEGEANLELEWENDRIAFAKIKFLNFRGIEKILENRPFLDALIITPRVCGICNTAHTIAAINAIEDAYRSMGEEVKISNKANYIREFSLTTEKIQNHIKWLYFSILPELLKLSKKSVVDIKSFEGSQWILAQKASAEILKATATFTGQWPHGSFCMVGGVTCDPTSGDVYEAARYLENVVDFCEKEIFGVCIEEFLEVNTSAGIMATHSTLKEIVEVLLKESMHLAGKSYGKFISFGENNDLNRLRKCEGARVTNVDIKYVSESLENSFFLDNGYTYSKSAMYKNKYFETGPIARMIINKDPLLMDYYKKYKDSVLTRVVARVSEIAHLLKRSRWLLDNIDISEPSCVSPKMPYKNLTAQGIGFCEAARGSLIHKIDIEKGFIKSYDIITPTVWNLGNGSCDAPAVAQKAIMGLKSIEKADLVFKSFDVCAVCTTQ